jgi:hypothetical protein
MKITKGKQTRPQRVVIYGVESVGKTTFAAQFPNPLLIDVENGSHCIDVLRWELETNPEHKIALWNEFQSAIESAKQTDQQTIIIDSADRVEAICREAICEQYKKPSIEDFGFGKGHVMVAERISRFLAKLDELIDAGKNVVFIAHSKVQRVEPPDLMTAYDRYELKMSKQSSPLVKEWADELWFFRFKTKVVESENGKAKGTGGKQRIILTTHSAAYDAKTRGGLGEELPMEWESVAHLFTSAKPKAKSEPAVVVVGAGHVRAFEMLEANEEAVNAFLVSNKSIQPGQTWRDVSEKLRANIVARPEALIAKALEAKGDA